MDNSGTLTIHDESFAAVAEFAPAMLWRGDENGKCVYLNRAQRVFWGVPDDGVASFTWSSTLLPEDADKVFGPFSKGMAEQKPFQCEARYRRADGAIRILLTDAEPRFDASGRFTGMVGVNRDVTDERRAQAELAESEARRALMMNEMSHRMKNMLATVISIAAQTARSAPSMDAFQASFQARVRALSKSHDLLLRDATDTAELRDILDSELRPYAAEGRALVLEGDAVRLGGRAALGLALVVHELATNAAKYGAYAAAGALNVHWRREGGDIVLAWRETGGPPAKTPAKSGFGTRLIEAVLQSDLEGAMQTEFGEAGFSATLRFPAP